MSMLPRSTSRLSKLLAAGAVRLMVAALLVQPAFSVVRAVVPAVSVEAQESEPAGESESPESEASTAAATHVPRSVRHCDRLESSPPDTRARRASQAARLPRPGSAAGHRLPNGLIAPLRC